MGQKVIWTVLPKSVDLNKRELCLSVRVSPRLTTGGVDSTLEKFADFAEWSSKQIAFELQFGDTTERWTAEIVDDRRDPALWSAVFPAHATAVKSHQPDDFRNRRIRSFPAANVLAFLRGCYQEAGLNFPDDLPSLEWLIGGRQGEIEGVLSELSKTAITIPELRRHLVAEFEKNRYDSQRKIVPSYPPHPSYDFLQAVQFHEPKGGDYHQPPGKPALDFHEKVSMVEEYSPLMRRLGLVFDLRCAMPSGLENLIKALPPSKRTVRVWSSWTPKMPGNPPDVRPSTVFEFNAVSGVFRAAPAGNELKGGLLDLSSDSFETVQVDLDGAAIKLVDFTGNLLTLQNTEQTPATPDKAGLPALRSAGLSVIRTGRSEEFWSRFQKAGTLNDSLGDNLLLYAEDVTRGFIVDVLDSEAGFWRSLCMRREIYGLRRKHGETPGKYEEADREATVITSVTSRVNQSEPDLYLHESLFHWEGWSLAVRRPGKTVPDPRSDPHGNDPDYQYVGDSGPEDDLEPGLVVLTDLVREKDLNTGKMLVKGTLPRLRFGRTYRLRARTVDLAGNGPELKEKDALQDCATPSVTYRRFEPVASPVLARGPEKDPYLPGESMERLVIRSFNPNPADNVTPSVDKSERYVAPPRISQQAAEQHGMFDVPPPSGLGESWYEILVEKHGEKAHLPDPLKAPLTDVPYLPDPLAGGVSIHGLPGEAEPRMIEFNGGDNWPSSAPCRVRLVEGCGPATWDEKVRILTVYLPKAGRALLRLSCHLPSAGKLDLLGVWDWIRQAASTPRLAMLEKIAVMGGHWMLTPFREVTLVHAVQKPLEPPRFEGPAAAREKGETFVKVNGKIQVHGASTGKVEIWASWRDRVDNAPIGTGDDWSPPTPDEYHSGHAFDLVNGEERKDELDCGGNRHEFGDTRYRLVRYRARAASRFRDYFDPGLSFDIDGEETEIQILNSARPAAPEIEYVVPLFDWKLSEEPDGTFSRRGGGGVRVYLRRPWYSSGDGELLGVVIAHGPQKGAKTPDLPNSLAGHVTQWGFDPIWLSYPVYPAPSVHHFPLAVAQETGVTIEEAQTLPSKPDSWWLSVAGHDVFFDAERQLWYCDIAMDAGPSYYPFVRLAVARYQPRSVWGVQLSRVVTADFIQLTPDRLAWIAVAPDDPALVKVSVSGPSTWYEKGSSTPTVMIVRPEMQHPGDEDGDIWLPVEPGWQFMSRTQITTAVTVWSGLVRLPASRGTRRFRLVVEEYEVMRSDPQSDSALGLLFNSRSRTGARLVYADTIEI